MTDRSPSVTLISLCCCSSLLSNCTEEKWEYAIDRKSVAYLNVIGRVFSIPSLGAKSVKAWWDKFLCVLLLLVHSTFFFTHVEQRDSLL